MSFPVLVLLSVSEVTPLDFWPCMVSPARWFLPAGDFSSDCVDIMPGSAVARFIWPAELPRSDDGAPCGIVEPPEGASRLMPAPCPAPCALAKLVPARSAAAATVILKRLIMKPLLTYVYCPRRQRQATCDVPWCREFLRISCPGIGWMNAR